MTSLWWWLEQCEYWVWSTCRGTYIIFNHFGTVGAGSCLHPHPRLCSCTCRLWQQDKMAVNDRRSSLSSQRSIVVSDLLSTLLITILLLLTSAPCTRSQQGIITQFLNHIYFAGGNGGEVLWWARLCVCVCVCVCMFVCLSANISPEPHAQSLPIFVDVAYGRASVLLRQGDENPRGKGSLGFSSPRW